MQAWKDAGDGMDKEKCPGSLERHECLCRVVVE
jgi:hypothetical protein